MNRLSLSRRARPDEAAATAGGVSAVAFPNIALVKYWGKRDEALILPAAGSVSVTLDVFPTTTTVAVDAGLGSDVVMLNGRCADGDIYRRVVRFLDLVRQWADRNEFVVVDSANTVPTGAGLASSASGFAALAAAATQAYGLRLGLRDLSRLARRGSGSACRSIFGGLVQWHAGTGGGEQADLSSYAEPIATTGLDPALVIALVDTGPKAISSRDAMRHTAATSPLYLSWIASCMHDLDTIRAAIGRGDLAAVGEITEHNGMGMHATMLAARPGIRFLSPPSVAVLDRITSLRAEGISVYATVDAGPNVVALCDRGDGDRVSAALGRVPGVAVTHVAHPGPGVSVNADPT